jgi:hypothetical protein
VSFHIEFSCSMEILLWGGNNLRTERAEPGGQCTSRRGVEAASAGAATAVSTAWIRARLRAG